MCHFQIAAYLSFLDHRPSASFPVGKFDRSRGDTELVISMAQSSWWLLLLSVPKTCMNLTWVKFKGEKKNLGHCFH